MLRSFNINVRNCSLIFTDECVSPSYTVVSLSRIVLLFFMFLHTPHNAVIIIVELIGMDDLYAIYLMIGQTYLLQS